MKLYTDAFYRLDSSRIHLSITGMVSFHITK